MYTQIINTLKDFQTRALVSIDGNCGSGKTELSNIISAQIECNVIPIDHYYLPFEQRKENWKEIPGGNIDFKRLKEEVILPFMNHQQICSTRFNPHEQKLTETTCLPDRPLLIIEGSYSSHPEIRSYFDYFIFLTCSSDTQIKRLKKREKDHFSAFAQIWIQKENDYFIQCSTQQNADIVIDTTTLF